MTRRRLLLGVIGLSALMFVGSLVYSTMFKQPDASVTKKSKTEVFEEFGAGKAVSKARAGVAYRQINEETGEVEWEARGEEIEQLGEKQFSLTRCDLDLMQGAGVDGTPRAIRVSAAKAAIDGDHCTLTDGVEIASGDGVTMRIADANVEFREKRIHSVSPVVITRVDAASGAEAVRAEGVGFECDSGLNHFRIPKITVVEVRQSAGLFGDDAAGAEPLKVYGGGALEIDIEKGLLTFHDDVRCIQGGSKLTCDAVQLTFSRAAESAQQFSSVRAEGNVDFTILPGGRGERTVHGRGDQLIYSAERDMNDPRSGKPARLARVIELSGSRPHLTMDDDRLEADSILLLHAELLAVATGAVEFSVRGGVNTAPGEWFGGASSDTGGGAASSKPWQGGCDTLTVAYSKADDSAPFAMQSIRLTGAVTAGNGESSLQGDELSWNAVSQTGMLVGAPAHILDPELDVTAGRIDLDQAGGRISAQPLQKLVYTPRAIKADSPLAGSAEWRCQAGSATVTFTPKTRAIRAVQAAQAVAIDSDAYQAKGENLSWDFEAGRAAIDGAPAWIRDVKGDNEVRAEAIVWDETGRRVTAERNVDLRMHRSLALRDLDGKPTEGPASDLWHVQCQSARVTLAAGDDGKAKTAEEIVLIDKVTVNNGDYSGACRQVTWRSLNSYFKAEAEPGQRLLVRRGEDVLQAESLERISLTQMILLGRVDVVTRPQGAAGRPPVHLTAGRMDVVFADDGASVSKVVASEQPRFEQDAVQGEGDSITWLEESASVLMEGRPARVAQGEDVLTADKIIYYRDDHTAMGQGAVRMTFHSQEAPEFEGARVGTEWSVSAEHFRVEFESEPKGDWEGVKSAVIGGTVALRNGDFFLRGSRFEWDGARQRGILYGDPRVRVKLDDKWIEGDAIAFSPHRHDGGRNWFSVIGPVRAEKPAEKK